MGRACVSAQVRSSRKRHVAMKIYRANPDAVPGAFKEYISGAEAIGIVVSRKQDRLELPAFDDWWRWCLDCRCPSENDYVTGRL